MGSGVSRLDLESGANVLVTTGDNVDMREVFLESVADPDAEKSSVILLATAESGHSLFDDFRQKLPETEDSTLEVIDGSVRIPERIGTEDNIRYVPPVSEYLAQLGDEFSKALDDLETEFGNSEDILSNRVGFYSLGPLLDFAGDTELVFRFICILVNQIEDAGGNGVFVIDSSYSSEIKRLEVLFDKTVAVERGTDGDIEYKVANAI